MCIFKLVNNKIANESYAECKILNNGRDYTLRV